MSKRILTLLTVLAIFAISIGAAAQDETVIVIGWEQEPDVLEPLSNAVFSELLQSFYSRAAWDWDEHYNLLPELVEEIPTIENGLVTFNDAGNTIVTYKLRKTALWSDGEPVTADDLLFGHRLYSDVTTGTIPRGAYPQVVESVEKIDDHTVVQTFNIPYPDYINQQVYVPARWPQHVLEPLLESNGGTIDGLSYFTRAEGVVGYGPYIFENWTLGESITFVKNPYWDGQEPAIDRVILRFITDTAQLRNALELGEIDLSFNFSDQLAISYANIENVEVWNTTSTSSDALWFNIRPEGTQHPALKDINVRKAIVHAIDRVSHTKAIGGENAQVPLSRESRVWIPEDVEYLDYNPELAAQLLDEAGWVDSNGNGLRDKDGQELILRIYTTPTQSRTDYQLAIQSDLTKVGIGTQLFQVPGPSVLFGSYTNRGLQATGEFDLSIYSFGNDPISPNINLGLTTQGIPGPDAPSGTNFSGFSNPRVDELYALINSNVDPVSRLEQKHESIKLVNDAVYWIGLLERQNWYALRSDRFDASTFRNNGTLTGNYFNQVEFWQPVQP